MRLSESITKTITRRFKAHLQARAREADLGGGGVKEKRTCFITRAGRGNQRFFSPPLFVFKATLSGSMSMRETENPIVDLCGRN